VEELDQLAELYGVQTSYYEVSGKLVQASPEALTQVLGAFGSGVSQPNDAADALRARRQFLADRWIEPVNVLWDDRHPQIFVHVPAARASVPAKCTLTWETGETADWSLDLAQLPDSQPGHVDEYGRVRRLLSFLGPLPLGYQKFTIEWDGKSVETTLISAPVRAFDPPVQGKRCWGVFVPLYALQSERSWGVGDFSDLEALHDWVASQGGDMVATLPLLTTFLDQPFEPGPYSPASRLFWNELYLDVLRIPEFGRCPRAQELVRSAEFQKELADLRSLEFVDYRRQISLKKRVLVELSRCFFSSPGQGQKGFDEFARKQPYLEDYATFRAVGDKLRTGWPAWPEKLRDGNLSPGDYDDDAKRYHLYAQWQADCQLQHLAAKSRAAGLGLYVDLPLGVNPDSYDVWRKRDCFASGFSAGAPPDPFFSKGQSWGFPPLHPERIRDEAYRYVRAYVHHHLRLAGVLRIDHMMGLHRLFWIPPGMEARDGVYVRYRADELYAVFNVESHRHRSVLVGEDLGTVPPEVPEAMKLHNVRRMYVLQFMLRPDPANAIASPSPGSFANINTHDLPAFAAFWNGSDLEDLVKLGALDRAAADREFSQRRERLQALVQFLHSRGRLRQDAGPLAVLKQCLSILSADSASAVLANLEDLWLETRPQNIPGTWQERPNWRRKARHSLETIKQMPEVLAILAEMDRAAKS
jgi:4-alpha-glucanotransferase